MISSQSILSLKDESLYAVLKQLRESVIVSSTMSHNVNSPCFNLLPIAPIASTLFRKKSDSELSAIIDFISNGTLPFPHEHAKVIIERFCMHPTISNQTLLKIRNTLCGGRNSHDFESIDRINLTQTAQRSTDDDIKQLMKMNLAKEKSNLLRVRHAADVNLIALLSTEVLSEHQTELIFDYCIEMNTPESLMLLKKSFQEGFVNSGYIDKTVFKLTHNKVNLVDLPLTIFIKICLSECSAHNKDNIFDLIANNKFDNYAFRPSVYSAKDLGECHLTSLTSLLGTDEKYNNCHKEQFGIHSLNNLRHDVATRLLNEHYYPKILNGDSIKQDILVDSILSLRNVTVYDIDVWAKYGIKTIMDTGGKGFAQFLDEKIYSGPLSAYFTTTLLKEKASIGYDGDNLRFNAPLKTVGNTK